MLQVEGLVCGYGQLPIIHNLDFCLDEAESVAILGANGAGKSTLMKALSRSLPSLEGSIRWQGEELTGWASWQAARAGIGYVPQEANVFPALTVRENLQIGADSRGDGDEEIASILERFPILGRRSRQLAGTLSGGERQMLALAAALLMRPSALLLDEPTSGLSPVAVDQLVDLIKGVTASGVSIVWVVEQDPEIVVEVVSKGYLMAGGQFVKTFDAVALSDRQLLAELVTGGGAL